MGKEIKEYAAKKLPTGSFEFLGYLSNEKVLDVYFQYDVDFFINLSDSEGIPVSIMEAMSIGIPVIARDVGGTREIVNPTNGLILKEPLEENFDEKIIEFMKYRLDNIEYYKQLSNNCLKIWEDKYNLEKNNEMFIKKILEE
jgi:glycosyltransferase involved in cell wall biosynthesis